MVAVEKISLQSSVSILPAPPMPVQHFMAVHPRVVMISGPKWWGDQRDIIAIKAMLLDKGTPHFTKQKAYLNSNKSQNTHTDITLRWKGIYMYTIRYFCLTFILFCDMKRPFSCVLYLPAELIVQVQYEMYQF